MGWGWGGDRSTGPVERRLVICSQSPVYLESGQEPWGPRAFLRPRPRTILSCGGKPRAGGRGRFQDTGLPPLHPLVSHLHNRVALRASSPTSADLGLRGAWRTTMESQSRVCACCDRSPRGCDPRSAVLQTSCVALSVCKMRSRSGC